MRILNALLGLCLGWALEIRAEDLTTLTGQTYADIVVQRYDWEGLFIKHAGGISKVYYHEIPTELREFYKNMVPAPNAAEKADPHVPADVGPNDLATRSGTVYRNAAVRRMEADAVLIDHDGGLAKVPFADIPEDLQEKFRTPPKPALETPLGSNDLAAADGRIYRNVQVRKIEPDGLTLRHDAGLTKLAFPLLPEDWQRKYEYDPQQAARYERATAAARAQAERDRQALREQNAAARSRQIKNEPIRVFEVRAAKTGEHEYRVTFSVRNYGDQPAEIVANIAPMGIKKFVVPANGSQSGLEVTSWAIKPEQLVVTCGAYSTSQMLDW